MRVLSIVLLLACALVAVSALNIEQLQEQLAPGDGVTHTVTTQADGSIAVTATATSTVIIPAGDAAAEPANDEPIQVGASNVACTRPIGPSPSRITIPAAIVQLAARRTYPAATQRRGLCPAGKAMPSSEVRQMLVAAWTAFGATAAQASRNADRNLAQVRRESTYCPNIVQGIIRGDPNNNNPAGGLFQFIPATFNFWKVRGYDNRYNPLSNILAAVNAQVNARCISPASHGRVLNGAAGWTPQAGRNPFA